jgi:hypothetical protein
MSQAYPGPYQCSTISWAFCSISGQTANCFMYFFIDSGIFSTVALDGEP